MEELSRVISPNNKDAYTPKDIRVWRDQIWTNNKGWCEYEHVIPTTPEDIMRSINEIEQVISRDLGTLPKTDEQIAAEQKQERIDKLREAERRIFKEVNPHIPSKRVRKQRGVDLPHKDDV